MSESSSSKSVSEVSEKNVSGRFLLNLRRLDDFRLTGGGTGNVDGSIDRVAG